MSDKEFIKIQDVSKNFEDVVAVDNINIDIARGEFFSLLGPSGCGKTTLLRILAGFEYPSSGSVFIGYGAGSVLTTGNQNIAIGEAEHPESSVINTDRVSHNILKTWWDGKTLMGKVEIIMSPGFVKTGIISCKGDIIANLLRKGISMGIDNICLIV